MAWAVVLSLKIGVTNLHVQRGCGCKLQVTASSSCDWRVLSGLEIAAASTLARARDTERVVIVVVACIN